MSRTKDNENDILNKRQVYVNVAESIQKKLGGPTMPMCLWAVLAICGETDPRLYEDELLIDMTTLDIVRNFVVGIKVSYKIFDSKGWERTTEMFSHENGKAAVSRTIEELPWDDVPDEVREDRLRNGVSEVKFAVFPRAP